MILRKVPGLVGETKVPALAKEPMDREGKRLILGMLGIFLGALVFTGLVLAGLILGAAAAFEGFLKLL